MSEGTYSYTLLQTSEVLHLTPKRVHELIDEGELKAHSDTERGTLLIDADSVRSRLKALSPDPQDAPETTTTTAQPDADQEEDHFFDLDLLILVLIAGITLLAAGYTLLPQLFGG